VLCDCTSGLLYDAWFFSALLLPLQVCAYTLPCWFGLKLLGSTMWRSELWLCHIMIPLSLLLSASGFYSSVHSLIDNIRSHGSGFGPPV
jgi:hypothetical protein